MSDDFKALRQRMVAEAVWKTVVLCWKDPEDRSGDDSRVAIRPVETVNALATCIAQAIAAIPEANARQTMLRQLSPAIERAVRQARNQPHIMLPKTQGIVLPN